MFPGEEIGIKIDHTLTQDATGTLAYLEFESLGLGSVKTELSVSYVDHNLLQTDFKNADDHIYLKDAAMRFGIHFSPPGNGVSHQVHMERFSVPGKTLLGSDSHTSTQGGMGMLAIGAGGLDVALSMAGEPFFFRMPRVMGVRLKGKFRPWVSAKDLILEMLLRHTVKGGLGKIIEYFGEGVKNLSAGDRATIANMGAELGATTSVFPSDERTLEFLKRQGRAGEWMPIFADKGADYGETDEIDLKKLEPLIACPSSPDNVKKVKEVEGTPVGQAIVGSSANSSFRDIMMVCNIFKGRTVHPGVSLEINPGSRQVLENIARANGALTLTHAGARIHQSGCLGCIGIGQAPATGINSVRTFPRNFPGRSGTENDSVYLSSPETAAAAAFFGKITDPRRLGRYPRVAEPEKYLYNDSLIIKPLKPRDRSRVEIRRGPNIAAFPDFTPLPPSYEGEVLLKVADNITTDHILPGGDKVMSLRSNIPLISEHLYERVDPSFVERCAEKGGGIIIGGENYGQGSSREHAAVASRYLGVRIKIAKSFARIHRGNLVNMGIVPLLFKNPSDYGTIRKGDTLSFPGLRKTIEKGADNITATLKKEGRGIPLRLDLSERERASILAGGLLKSVMKKKTAL